MNDHSTSQHNLSLTQRIGALLFAAGDRMTFAQLADMLTVSQDEIMHTLPPLIDRARSLGIGVLQTDEYIQFVTLPEAHDDVVQLVTNIHTGDLSPAALETLSIVLYSGPVPQRDIDYIRGVNSSSILRTLCARGLIEKRPSSSHERATMYQPSGELYRHLGITQKEDMPDYGIIQDTITQMQNDADNTDI